MKKLYLYDAVASFLPVFCFEHEIFTVSHLLELNTVNISRCYGNAGAAIEENFSDSNEEIVRILENKYSENMKKATRNGV